MVTKDMTKYTEILSSWPLDQGFKPSLDILTEIGNLFVLGPEALKERLRGAGGGLLAGVDKSDLRPYILRREDAGSVSMQTVLNGL
jgi:exocyst complex component 5